MKPYHNTKPFISSEFIKQSLKVHGEKYDYSLVKDSGRKSYLKVEIKCLVHGVFLQEAGYHLKGSGCPKCARLKINQSIRKKFSAIEFIKSAKRIHGDAYDYSLVADSETSTHIKVTLICPNHGKFSVSAKDHLGKRGGRCPRCSKKESYGEFLIRKCLLDHKVNFLTQKKFDGLRDAYSKRKLAYDFFLPDKNILIEFDGEYHSFPPNFKKASEIEMQEIQETIKLRDNMKTNFAKNSGIELIRISFKDRNPASIYKILKDYSII